jgi:hypothetical protein
MSRAIDQQLEACRRGGGELMDRAGQYLESPQHRAVLQD